MAEPGTIPFGVRALLGSLFAATFGTVGMVTIVGLQVFDITGDEFDLGLLGIAEFVPVLLLSPLTGTVADRHDRRLVFAGGLAGLFLVALGLLLYALTEPDSVLPIFGLVVVLGAARSFVAPSSRAMPIDMAPADVLERVIALKSLAFQVGVISAPIVCSFAYLISPAVPYGISMFAFVIAASTLLIVPSAGVERLGTTAGGLQALRDARAGLRFIRGNPVLRATLSLDLFAVLLGGAIVLLPAIAEKRLGVGTIGFGFLRAAFGGGAAAMAICLSLKPLRRHVGRTLLLVVATFGTATIVLGLTRSYLIAVLAVIVAAAADQMSVFIRSSLVPLATPENMRGRVLAVENIFIGGSNELGAAESGITARLMGLSAAVVFGGIGTLVVVGVWWWLFPALRRVDRFADVRPVVASAGGVNEGVSGGGVNVDPPGD